MNDYQENIVPAVMQNSKDIFLDPITDGYRILFVGNSITKHAPKPAIGWLKDCGMAASCVENDYVHIMERAIKKEHPNACFGIVSAANFEWNFDTVDLNNYRAARDFEPDIILMFFGANVKKTYDETITPEITFGQRYEEFRNYLVNGRDVKVAHSQGFYIRPKLDEEKARVASKYNDVFINIESIRNMPEAHGQFNHPGDYGMKLLAEKFLESIF